MATTEERLAALEKQMAAWIDQQPTTYYTHQYSGEEIDAAVGRALTGGALDTSVTNVSNQLGTFVRPNLLDNWYFGRPVNQRGKSEYTGSGYMVDRWTAKEGFISLSSSGLTLQNSTWLDQIIENLIENRIYTISLLTANGVLLAGTGLLNKDSFISVRIDGGGYINISYHADVSGYYVELARADAAQPLSILAAKLELGPTQTLAHKENGQWVLNEVPDYGEQLRRCQRYFWRFQPAQYTAGATAFGYDTNTARSFIYFPGQMRTTPTLNFNANTGLFLSGSNGDIFTPTLSGIWVTPNIAYVQFKKNAAFAPNAAYVVRGDGVSAIDMSADL